MKLTANFTLEELCASTTAKVRNIPNVPNEQQEANLRSLAINVLQPLRSWYGRPIPIGSGFRSSALNKAVGGVSNSQHMTGEAADLCINGSKARGWKWFEYIRDNLPFDQLIWEHNKKTGSYWVHVSCKADLSRNRKQVITYLLKK